MITKNEDGTADICLTDIPPEAVSASLRQKPTLKRLDVNYENISTQMKHVFIFLIRVYQIVFWPIRQLGLCKFEPHCSAYGIQAIQQHGAFRGSWLTIKRIARCNPFTCGGHDPVPLR